MFCWNCGAQIEDKVKFCSSCGAAVNGQASVNQGANIQPLYPPQRPPVKSKSALITGLSMLIAGLLGGIISGITMATDVSNYNNSWSFGGYGYGMDLTAHETTVSVVLVASFYVLLVGGIILIVRKVRVNHRNISEDKRLVLAYQQYEKADEYYSKGKIDKAVEWFCKSEANGFIKAAQVLEEMNENDIPGITEKIEEARWKSQIE